MQDLMQFITDRLGPAGPLYLVGGLGLFLILLTIPFFLKKQDDPLEKLKASNQGVGKDGTDKHREALRAKQANERLERYSTFLEPQNEEEYSAIKLKLLQAGYRSKDAVRYYYFAQFALGILGLLAGTIYFMLFIAQTEPTTQTTLMWILGPGGAGYYLPKYWVNKRLTERKQEIEEGFPTAWTCCWSASRPASPSTRRSFASPRNCAPPTNTWPMNSRWSAGRSRRARTRPPSSRTWRNAVA